MSAIDRLEGLIYVSMPAVDHYALTFIYRIMNFIGDDDILFGAANNFIGMPL